MIDKNEVKRIIEERKKLDLNDVDGIDKKWIELLNSLGDDEKEACEFLKSIDDDIFYWIEEIYEETVEKFPSDEMEDIFKKYYSRHKDEF